MYCTNCGTERPDHATVCAQCQQKVVTYAPPESVPNHLVQAILVTLCCCLPFGVVALIYSSQVNTKLAVGDVAGAQASSRLARNWVLVSFLVGILLGIASVAINLLNLKH